MPEPDDNTNLFLVSGMSVCDNFFINDNSQQTIQTRLYHTEKNAWLCTVTTAILHTVVLSLSYHGAKKYTEQNVNVSLSMVGVLRF